MNNKRVLNVSRIFLAALIYVSGPSPESWATTPPRPAPDHRQTWCAQDERIYFSCQIGQKTVSLCGSDRITKTEGYLQYRFGRLGKEAELLYPAAPVHPQGQFRDYMELGAQAFLYEISFQREGHEYTVFVDTSAGMPTYGMGIFVGKVGDPLRMLSCTGKVHEDRAAEFRMYDGKVLERHTGESAKSRFMDQGDNRKLLK